LVEAGRAFAAGERARTQFGDARKAAFRRAEEREDGRQAIGGGRWGATCRCAARTAAVRWIASLAD
jgi:hypothetical protein